MIEARHLKKQFRIKKNQLLTAVDNVSFSINKGETLGLVGESGCGKSTVGKLLLRLEEPTGGTVSFNGIDLSSLSAKEMRTIRRHMQIVFQDPYSSLNPRMRVKEILGEPLDIHHLAQGQKKIERILELLNLVGLDEEYILRYPHAFSGGQRQRIGIARALAVEPQFLVLDEPLAALDAVTQLRIVSLLKDLQKKFQMAYLFISHDLKSVEHLSHWVGVMYLGQLVEYAPCRSLFENPLHPYTQALISAIPIPDPALEKKRSRIVLNGEIPSPLNKPQGCVFHTRCPYALPLCKEVTPFWQEIKPNHFAACHRIK